MQSIQLGKSDLIVSRICFGCWQLSPRFWGAVALDDWQNALRRALDLGINFIDTADAYGDGYAESCLGEFLAREGLRDRFVIATKFYWNFEQKERHPDTSHDYILRACEASLQRLRTDRIDLYQIHSWDPLLRPEEVAAAFARLKQQGKVRWIGVSNWNADQLRMGLEFFGIECLQPCYNLLTRGIEARELPLCLEKRLGVIAYSPLHKGLLTGKYTPGHQFGDHRDKADLFHGKPSERIREGLRQLEPIAATHGLTLPQLAIRWVLTHPALSCAIVGVKRPEHIETIVAAADAKLPAADWHKAAGIMDQAGREASALAEKKTA
jgi:aryl-alcohol dehydrogenase-like predicted oxidoreductase